MIMLTAWRVYALSDGVLTPEQDNDNKSLNLCIPMIPFTPVRQGQHNHGPTTA